MNTTQQMLADQTHRRYAAAARRPRHRVPGAATPRTLRHTFWRDRLVVTVSYRPAH